MSKELDKLVSQLYPLIIPTEQAARHASDLTVIVEEVLQLLDSAMRSEEEFVEEFLRARELLRAAEAQTRLRALQAFRHSLMVNLSREKDQGKLES
jgi:hypothetical protein